VRPATALLPGSKASFNETAAFEEIEHTTYFRESGAGARYA
jgi:hypothetical protein